MHKSFLYCRTTAFPSLLLKWALPIKSSTPCSVFFNNIFGFITRAITLDVCTDVSLTPLIKVFFGSTSLLSLIFSYLFPGCFFWWFLDLNQGVWDWKTKHLAREVLQRSTFAEIGFLMIPGSVFHGFGWPWDQFSWLLLPWRLTWNLMTFQGDSGVSPDPAPRQVHAKCLLPGP